MKSSKVDLKVHLWGQDLATSRGGIQAYSRYLVGALRAALEPGDLHIFSKNDTTFRLKTISGLHGIGAGSWPRSLRSAAFALQTLSQAFVQRPGLVILSHLNFGPLALWLKRLSRTPYWCVAHGVESWGLKRPDRVRGLQSASRIFAVSSYTRQRLIDEQRLNPDRVRILPNTFSPEIFRPACKADALLKRHAIHSSNRIILTVARLSESEKYKGYDQIIRALPQILSAIPEVHFVLVGEGQDRERIERLIASLGLRKSVTLTGAVSDAELPAYYNLCDVFAMPSKGEGFGIVYLEALACGKPVLAGNIDGSSDPLQNGKLGAMVNPDNITEIAEALKAILNRTYPLQVLYKPDELRERTIKAFGPERFFAEVRRQLEEFQLERCSREARPPKPVEPCHQA